MCKFAKEYGVERDTIDLTTKKDGGPGEGDGI